LAGCAACAEWEKEEQPPMSYGSAVTVDANSDNKTWILLMRLGAKTGCHQMHERSFFWKGSQFPLCARCTGLLIGQAAALFLFLLFVRSDIRILLCLAGISVLIMGIDGLGQLKNIWLSTNPRRLVTGLLCGCFVTIFNINFIIMLVKFLRN
jgi:uncharacterized membrane protein